MRNPQYKAVLERMADLHDRKNDDYADDGDPYSNFRGAAAVAGCTVETLLRGVIGIKLERLRQLLDGAKVANFESVEDNVLDLAVYAAILAAYVIYERDGAQVPGQTRLLDGGSGDPFTHLVDLSPGGSL